ncbi:hypothetical protein SRRS_33890 [Sporomusa rhizae]|uniref:DUF350 domain-containing protein n=1 Tax=Sporomusa rhizae TaxID=357999 RepID=UPI00352AE86B
MSVQLPNIINFLMYLSTAIPLMILGIYVFTHTTPYDDFALIRSGGEVESVGRVDAAIAAALDICGKVLGLTMVIASAIWHAVNISDLFLWGVIGIVVEVLVFCLLRCIVPLKVIEEIPKGNISVGLFSATISVASGLLLAALLSY